MRSLVRLVALSTGIGLNGHGERIRAPASSSIDAFRRERAKIFLTSKIDAYQGASCRLGAIAATRKQLVAAWRYVIRCPGTYRLVDWPL
jgi:hypothetical protein